MVQDPGLCVFSRLPGLLMQLAQNSLDGKIQLCHRGKNWKNDLMALKG